MQVAYEVESSWANDEDESGPLPTEVYKNGFEILTEYKYYDKNNNRRKKVKVVRVYKIGKPIKKIEKIESSKKIAKNAAAADGGGNKCRDKTYAIRITNLSEMTNEADLEKLVEPFGLIKKRYLAKRKKSNLCKGFAYVHFKFRGDAERAIARLNGYGFDHLILNVDWSYSSAQ